MASIKRMHCSSNGDRVALEEARKMPHNDVEKTKMIDELPCDSLAAVLIEHILGNCGCFVGKEAFLQYLRAICPELGALLLKLGD
jgi:glutamate-1-semialdehyde aminotransferase